MKDPQILWPYGQYSTDPERGTDNFGKPPYILLATHPNLCKTHASIKYNTHSINVVEMGARAQAYNTKIHKWKPRYFGDYPLETVEIALSGNFLGVIEDFSKKGPRVY